MTIHYNGDYTGDYILSDIHRKKDGEQIDAPRSYSQIFLDEKRFNSIARKLIRNNAFNLNTSVYDIKLKGTNTEDSRAVIEIAVNSSEIVDFYLNKLRSIETTELEQLNLKQLIKRYFKKKS